MVGKRSVPEGDKREPVKLDPQRVRDNSVEADMEFMIFDDDNKLVDMEDGRDEERRKLLDKRVRDGEGL